MKAWLSEHKFYIVAAFFIALGCFYYSFIYQTEQDSNQQIKTVEKKASPKKSASTPKSPDKVEVVMVDVKGEIKQPGVYSSSQTERVIDVIQKAGGLTDKADASQVNFAAHVEDAMVVYIPAKGQTAGMPANQTTAQSGSASSSGTNKSSKININKADTNDLQNLPGIGPAKATAIIQYRDENGLFQTIEDLKNVSGIGDKTFEKLQESITVQ